MLANRASFSHIVDRVHTELPKEESLDLLHQMNVYLRGWIFDNFKEAFEMDFIRPNYRTIADADIEEGMNRQAMETARKMLAENEPLKKIILYSGLTEDRVQEIQAEMQKS